MLRFIPASIDSLSESLRRGWRRGASRGGEEGSRLRRSKGPIGSGWWWTPMGKEGACISCSKRLVPPEKIAYHHPTRKIYCPDCARKERISRSCKPSKKLREIAA